MIVPDDEWCSPDAAATTVGVSRFRVKLLLGNRHLRSVRNSGGEPGISIDSLEHEQYWRTHASRRARSWRLFVDVVSAL